MKRSWFGLVLLGLGALLLVAAILGVTWAPGVAKKTPIDVNTTTYLSGSAQKYNPATDELESYPIYVVSLTQSDTKASSDTTAIWVSSSCVVKDTGGDKVCVDGKDPNLVVASIDTFATDRVSALAVDSSKLPADAGPHEGLMNKFPFDSAKKNYPYWDGTAGTAVDAVYDRTETVDGMEAYVYKVTIKDAPIKIGDLDGTYDDVKEVFVEPATGAIVNQTDDQQRYLADGTKVLDLQIAFTPDQVKTSVADTQDSLNSLNLITKTVPLVGFIGGALCLLGGAALLLTARRRSSDETSGKREDAGAAVG